MFRSSFKLGNAIKVKMSNSPMCAAEGGYKSLRFKHLTASLAPANTALSTMREGNNFRFMHLTALLNKQFIRASNYKLPELSMEILPRIYEDFTAYATENGRIEEPKWLQKFLQYYLPHSAQFAGRSVVSVYEMIARSQDLNEENQMLTQYLGWCVEMWKIVTTILDDIMDESEIRLGKKSWHLNDDVAPRAATDALLLEMGIYHLLKKYFGDKDYYIAIVESFHERTFMMALGMCLDDAAARSDVTSFSMQARRNFVIKKAGNFFYLPVEIAMKMAGCKDEELFRQAEAITHELSYLYIAQNDFLDVFGDPSVTLKARTDIQNGNCTWLAISAMQEANEEQKLIMKECYGQNDPEKVKRVKKLYEDLMLPKVYKTFFEERMEAITKQIQQLPPELPLKPYFLGFLDMLISQESACA